MSDDRPKKSWRDIDRSREKGRDGSERGPSARERERVEKSAAYSKYKSQLDKLFTPGGAALPESLRDKLGPASPEAAHRRKLLDALRASPSDETLRAFVAEGAPLPEDARLLMGLLDLKDESLLIPVLKALLALVEGGQKPSRMLLVQKLDALKHRASDAEVIELASTLRAALE